MDSAAMWTTLRVDTQGLDNKNMLSTLSTASTTGLIVTSTIKPLVAKRDYIMEISGSLRKIESVSWQRGHFNISWIIHSPMIRDESEELWNKWNTYNCFLQVLFSKTASFNLSKVEEQFSIRISGFSRGINKTPSTVVLISSIDKKKTGFVYHDHWTTDGSIFIQVKEKTVTKQCHPQYSHCKCCRWRKIYSPVC